MIKFKRFKGFKRYATNIDNANVQDGGGPQATVGATAAIGEQSEPVTIDEQSVPKDLRLRDIHKHLTKRGWTEDRHSGGHKIYTHPTKGTVSVPAHPTAFISPGIVRQIFKISENEDDQELEAHPKPRKSFMKKATNASLPTDKHQIATIISGDGTIGLSEDLLYEGTGTHEYTDHIEPEHQQGYDADPSKFERKHLYTDTHMYKSHIVHTHHMTVLPHE